jgi:UDP-N-acetylmuramoyl-tripeptide--D-alanyl-D-alanine ligase
VCGVPSDAIVDGLQSSLPEVGRQEILHGRGDVTVVNDAYNANPDSMRAALTMFAAMKVEGRRFAVLGDMGELGDFAVACHEGVGTFLASLDLYRLICVGELARHIASAAIAAGFPESRVRCTLSRGEALNELETTLEPGDAVLCKASHSMELDRIAKGLLD